MYDQRPPLLHGNVRKKDGCVWDRVGIVCAGCSVPASAGLVWPVQGGGAADRIVTSLGTLCHVLASTRRRWNGRHTSMQDTQDCPGEDILNRRTSQLPSKVCLGSECLFVRNIHGLHIVLGGKVSAQYPIHRYLLI